MIEKLRAASVLLPVPAVLERIGLSARAAARERAYKKSTLVARLIRQFPDIEGFQKSRESPFEKLGRGR